MNGPRRLWRGIWLAPLAFLALALLHLVAGRPDYGIELMLTSLLVAAAIWLGVVLPRRWTLLFPKVAILIVGVLLVLGFVGSAVYAFTWNKHSMDRYFMSTSVRTLFDFLLAPTELVHDSGRRTWLVRGDAESATLFLKGSLAPSTKVARWTGSPGVKIDNRESQTWIDVGGSPDYALLSVAAGKAIGGRSFTAKLEIRSDANVQLAEPQDAQAWMMVWGDPTLSSNGTSVRLKGEQWAEVEHTWQVPPDISTTVLRFLLRSDRPIVVRNVRISEKADGLPVPLVVLRLSSSNKRVDKLLPDEERKTHSITIPLEAKDVTNQDVTARIRVSPGYAFEVYEARLALDGGGKALPTPLKLRRQRFQFSHPTLAGHVLTVMTLTVLAVAWQSTVALRICLLITAAFVVWLTGSDAALIILLIAGMLLLRYGGSRRRFSTYRNALIVAFTAVLVAGLATDLGQKWLSDLTNRMDSWESFTDCVGAISLWPASPCPAFASGHAHNLVLQSLASGGLIELVLMAVAIIAMAIAPGRGHSPLIVLLASVVALQVFDYTFLYVGVLLPTAFAAGFFARQAGETSQSERLTGRHLRPSSRYRRF
jgi:hypothetical protein